MVMISPEKRLWNAVLILALDDAMRFRDKQHNKSQEHASWVVKNWVTSMDFIEVCHLADIDPNAARKTFLNALFGDWPEYNKIKASMNAKFKNPSKVRYYIED